MAKKASAQADFRSLLTDIQKKQFSPVYILMGEETYYIDRLTEALEAGVVAVDERDFNFSVYYGQDADIAEVIAGCQQYPFMAERRIVLLKEAQSMDRAKVRLDALAPYIERPNDRCVLVVAYKGESLKATSALIKSASKSDAVVFNSPRLRDWDLAAPITSYCRERKIGIGDDSVQMLIEYIGNDLSKLFGAIDKMIVAGASADGRITPERIRANIGESKEYSNFEFQTAIANKDYDRCMKIVNYFEANYRKNPTAVTTGFLFAFFSKLLIAQFSPDRSPAALKAATGCKSDFAFRDYGAALRKYSAMQTLNAIHLLRDFDIRSKGVGSFQNEHALLRELIFNIFAGNPDARKRN
ncbi:MAG: DNA polymerase III subunit delta [Muribaculaceae bacterium]|nr:DNA polymerase III subunit delta [Muribaculaceae bacterium]